MNKLQKLIALYQEERFSREFFRKAYAGIRRICKRNYLKIYRRLSGVPSAQAFASNEVYWCNCHVPEGDKVLYLTFDVEWIRPKNVDLILDVLKEKQVPAAFFLLGEKMAENVHSVRRIHAEGHVVGNHTTTHRVLTQCTRREIQQELSQCARIYHELTGEIMPKIMRPPFGKIDILTVQRLHKLGYQSCLWNMHVFDWKKEEPCTWEMFQAYLDTDLKPGAIILQHTFSDETTQHIGKYIDYCHAKGYRFASLNDFLSNLS